MSRVVVVIAAMVSVVIVLCVAAVEAAPATTLPVVSAGFAPRSFTAINDREWWVLGSKACGRRRCVAIEHTTNGGASFAPISTPPITPQGGVVPGLAFANRRDGFAWDKALWVTRNGGRSWAHATQIGDVDTLIVADGYVYALAYRGKADDQLWRSSLDGGPWTRLDTNGYTPEAGGPLAAHGATIILAASPPLNSLVADQYELVSTDRGAQFVAHRLHVGVEGCSGFDAISGRVIWTYCVPPRHGGQLRRSVNAGRTFTKVGPPDGQISFGGAFAAASATTAIVADADEPGFPRKRPYLTTDAGRHYIAAGPTGLYWIWFGFIDSTHGVALASRSGLDPLTLFVTTNGGRSYRPVSFQG